MGDLFFPIVPCHGIRGPFTQSIKSRAYHFYRDVGNSTTLLHVSSLQWSVDGLMRSFKRLNNILLLDSDAGEESDEGSLCELRLSSQPVIVVRQ